jgi:hypothetical protein
MKRGLVLALVGVAASGLGGQAQAQPREAPTAQPEYTFDGNLLRITHGDTSTVVDLGCAGRAALQTGAKVLVACGAVGVVEVDVSDLASPRLDGAMRVDGDATGLFLRDGRVWVEIAHVDARPVRVETPSPLSGAVPTLTPREVALPRAALAPLPPPDAIPAPKGVAPAEAPIENTERPSVVAPPRQGNLWELSFLTSAFVTFGTLGVGALGSASVVYRFELPFVLRAEFDPFGVAGPSTNTSSSGAQTQTSNGAITTAAAHLLFGIDTQFLEVSIGIGGATVNQNIGSVGGSPATGALSIAESARIGARDGLALNLESSAIAAGGQFNLGYFLSSLQIPITRIVMLVVRGGGGPVGFAYGDLGVRVLAHGDGGKGTVALTGFAGGAAIMVDLCSSNSLPPFTSACNSSTLGGPSLGGGVEWKL